MRALAWTGVATAAASAALADELPFLMRECSLLEAQVAMAEALTSRLGVLDESVNQNPSVGDRGPPAENDNRIPIDRARLS